MHDSDPSTTGRRTSSNETLTLHQVLVASAVIEEAIEEEMRDARLAETRGDSEGRDYHRAKARSLAAVLDFLADVELAEVVS